MRRFPRLLPVVPLALALAPRSPGAEEVVVEGTVSMGLCFPFGGPIASVREDGTDRVLLISGDLSVQMRFALLQGSRVRVFKKGAQSTVMILSTSSTSRAAPIALLWQWAAIRFSPGRSGSAPRCSSSRYWWRLQSPKRAISTPVRYTSASSS